MRSVQTSYISNPERYEIVSGGIHLATILNLRSGWQSSHRLTRNLNNGFEKIYNLVERSRRSIEIFEINPLSNYDIFYNDKGVVNIFEKLIKRSSLYARTTFSETKPGHAFFHTSFACFLDNPYRLTSSVLHFVPTCTLFHIFSFFFFFFNFNFSIRTRDSNRPPKI